MAKLTATEQKVVEMNFRLAKANKKALADQMGLSASTIKGHFASIGRKLGEGGPNETTAADSDDGTTVQGEGKASAVKGKAATMATTKAASRVAKRSKNGSKTAAKVKTSAVKVTGNDEKSPGVDDFVLSIEKEGSQRGHVAGGDEEDEF